VIDRDDRRLATVLYTDIVASTEQLAEMGDRAWRAVLDDHDRAIDQIVASYRGRVVHRLGDGVLATFDGPARAVRCAGAIRDQLGAHGVAVRAGLHTGEIELRGEDIAGLAVHTGARVAALAGSGEVLVSSTVRDLAAGSGIKFNDRGEHELKGVPGTWRLFSVDGF
jgi:class 3 adenylate cyclase